jgi:hypothetical protein
VILVLKIDDLNKIDSKLPRDFVNLSLTRIKAAVLPRTLKINEELCIEEPYCN